MSATTPLVLVGGPSGVGKTQFSEVLAKHLDLIVIQTDDLFQSVLSETNTTTHPELHFFSNGSKVQELDASDTLRRFLTLCEVFSNSIRSVINDRLESGVPTLLEGDHILPSLVAQFAGQVSGIFLYEQDEPQIVANYLSREPEEGPQIHRAAVSLLHGEWLRSECERLGLLVLPVRPWKDQIERAKTHLARMDLARQKP